MYVVRRQEKRITALVCTINQNPLKTSRTHAVHYTEIRNSEREREQERERGGRETEIERRYSVTL